MFPRYNDLSQSIKYIPRKCEKTKYSRQIREKEREREYEKRKNENQNGNLCIVERTYISILRFTCQIGNINFEVEPRKRNTYRPKNTLIDNELNYTINCKRKDDGDDGTEKKCFSSSNPSE